jgi:deoxyadenosine/deoxycytidine kinase
MIKASLFKNASVAAGLSAAQAFRQAAKIASYYEIREKDKLISFYLKSMRDWSLYAMTIHKIVSKGTK